MHGAQRRIVLLRVLHEAGDTGDQRRGQFRVGDLDAVVSGGGSAHLSSIGLERRPRRGTRPLEHGDDLARGRQEPVAQPGFVRTQDQFAQQYDLVRTGGKQGNSLGHRQSIRDITARIKAEQALEKAEHEMEKEIQDADSRKIATIEMEAIPTAEMAEELHKGDTANVGLIALKAEYYPILERQVTAARVARHFRGVIEGDVERFELANLRALNFLLHGALGGGGTLSLKTDAQGKVFSTALLRMEIDVPRSLRV